MTKIYTYDAWVRDFQPMPNHLRNQDHGLELPYETYGEEVEYVKLQDEKHIWTEVDGDSGTYILSGWHFVNRIQYYITNKPWTDDVEVPTWMERQCECVEDFDWDNPTYCEQCEEREGYISIPCETVEDLRQIYGESATIVG
jgi:hypothetical protein